MRLSRFVVVVVSLLPIAAMGQVTVKPLLEFSFQKNTFIGDDAKIAFSSNFAYISTPTVRSSELRLSNLPRS